MHVEIGTTEKSWITNNAIAAKVAFEIPALKLKLKSPLPAELQTEIRNGLSMYLLPANEAINSEGDEIILKTPPYGGFLKFINKASTMTRDPMLFEKVNQSF